jgi:hypothetical protein
MAAHPLQNRSFKDAGVNRGTAAYWTETVSLTAEDTAMFLGADGYTYPWDGLEENWGSWPYNHASAYSYVATNFVAAMFEELSNDTESFEFSWREPVDTGPVTYNHQSIWDYSVDYFTEAYFDTVPEDVEDFEDDWGSSPCNQSSKYAWEAGSFTRGLFDTGTDDEEDFENAWGVSPYNQAAVYAFDGANFTIASFDPLGPENVEDFEDGWTEALP